MKVFKPKYQKSSIVYRLTRLIIGIIILQTALFALILILGGVIDEAKANAYQLFHDKVQNRKDYIQREMKNNWTNFDPYVTSLSKLLARPEFKDNPDEFFSAASKELIPMLRTTQTTGAYIILFEAENAGNTFSSLYLRDYDPNMNAYGDDDIYMVSGPSELAKSLMIPLDQTWRHGLMLSEENRDFVMKPIEHASMSSKASLLGYWNKPFKLYEDDVTIITYTMPLLDSAGVLRGVIGIDLTLNYLTKFLPATELQAQDSLGYLLAFSEDDGQTLTPIVMGGALQQRMIDAVSPIEQSLRNEKYNVHLIENHMAKEDIYSVPERIALYPYNTPFEKEQWFLVGLMRGDYLLGYVDRITQIIWITLVISVILGTIGALIISRQMTRPIVELAKQVRESDPNNKLEFVTTGLLELDDLSKTIEVTNHLMLESASRLAKIVELTELPLGACEIHHDKKQVFLTEHFWNTMVGTMHDESHHTDYETFLTALDDYLSMPEADEIDVFKVSEQPDRWIRYKQAYEGNTQIGVVLDVTEEMLEKKLIKSERDHDALTGLLNRKGFQWNFEKWYSKHTSGISALIMFDLDCLKQINDTYGHKWGDIYIVAAVEQLKTLASSDKDLIGRRSGDEFVVLLGECDSNQAILERVDAFYREMAIKTLTFPDYTKRSVKISAGIMWINAREFSYDELLHFADEALYEAKRAQKGSYVISKL